MFYHIFCYICNQTTAKTAMNLQQIRQYENLELLAKQVVEGFITGLHKSPFHGFSVEFLEHRLYNTGESTKNIDWRLYARTDKLFVKRYEEETNLRCQFVIDASKSMYYPDTDFSKLKFSVFATAALLHLLKKQRDAAGLSIFSHEIDVQIAARASAVHTQLLFNQLEALLRHQPVARPTQAAAALHQIAEATHQRSLIVIFSDMLEGNNEQDAIFSALQHLKYRKHEVIFFHTIDAKQELNFEFENRPYEFTDLETNQKIKLNPFALKDIYKQKFEEFRQNLKLRCAQYQIDFIEADIHQNFDVILAAFMAKRTKMY